MSERGRYVSGLGTVRAGDLVQFDRMGVPVDEHKKAKFGITIHRSSGDNPYVNYRFDIPPVMMLRQHSWGVVGVEYANDQADLLMVRKQFVVGDHERASDWLGIYGEAHGIEDVGSVIGGEFRFYVHDTRITEWIGVPRVGVDLGVVKEDVL